MTHLLGMHWLREHPDNKRDLPHIERMQYKSIKLFKPAWNNPGFCCDLLTVLPKDTYILARDHALSEQKEDMWRDPIAAGRDHADQWVQKVRSVQYSLPLDRSFFLGINEPDATNGDRNAIDLYTANFLERLRANGLRGGAFSFSTGHPRTVDGTPHTPADYTVFERSHQAIIAGHHIGILHIYGTGAFPNAPGHFDRLRACPWTDVEWVVGEFGIDEHVIGGGEHVGFHRYYSGRLPDYCAWLDSAIVGINDPRIHSYQVYTYDFSHPWATFDVSPIHAALESYDWQHAKPSTSPAPPETIHLPSIGTGPKPPNMPVPVLIHPVAEPQFRFVTQPFGARPDYYKQFSVDGVALRGHNGIDFGTPVGTNIVAVDNGRVVEDADEGNQGYGRYIKLVHAWGESLYAHLELSTAWLGKTVTKGEIIGLSGNTGNSSGPHLHFGLRVAPFDRRDGWGGFTDPAPYLLGAPSQPAQSPSIPTLIKESATEFGLEWQLVASLTWAESSFNPLAVSKAGAKGLMQLMPPTWQEWSERVGGTDIFNPSHNLRVGCAYLAWLLRYFKGNEYQAILAYNFGVGNVSAGARPPDASIAYAERVLMGRDLLVALEASN